MPNKTEAVQQLAQRLLDMGVEEMPPRERRVIERIADRVAVARNVNREYDGKLGFGGRLADQVAAFGGSWTFIIVFGVVLVGWVGLNSVVLIRFDAQFDPYPFVFLNLILSMLAAIQAPVIMMSQNRQAMKDRLAAAHDYEVNLKAEIEIMALHDKLDRLRSDDLARLIRGLEQMVPNRENPDASRARPG